MSTLPLSIGFFLPPAEPGVDFVNQHGCTALSICTGICGIGEKYLYIFVQCAVMFSSHAFHYSYCEFSDSRPCVLQAAAAIWTSLRICIRKYGFPPKNRDTRRKCRHFFGYPGTHVLFYNRNTRFTAIKLAGSVIPPPPAYAPAGCRSPGRGHSPAHGSQPLRSARSG